MANDPGGRYYAVFTPPESWRPDLENPDFSRIQRLLEEVVAPNYDGSDDEGAERIIFRVVSLPTGRVRPRFLRDLPVEPRPLQRFIVGLLFANRDQAPLFLRRAQRSGEFTEIRLSIDLTLASTQVQVWCPSEAPDPIFSTRDAARALMRADGLQAWTQLRSGRDPGAGVFVIVVDQGLDRAFLEAEHPGAYAGGWGFNPVAGDLGYPGGPVLPGTAVGGHGTRMAMNILSLAPAARILDLPLLPPHIDNLLTFMSWAAEAMQQVLWDMEVLRIAANRVLPVVVCNAWSVYDTSTEPANQPNFRYSDNPAHDFNLTVAEADALRFDQVFAAGNCGQFCPDSRCGPNDIGPGRGILGANSHVAVLTVGAVRADGLWLGYSSQGPGQPDLGTNKPDLVAPSQFEEVRDSNSLNSGTSTSCGLAAGGVAALRTVTGPVGLPPAALRGRLRNTARQRGADDIWRSGVQWNMRLGHGVMDLADILNQI